MDSLQTETTSPESSITAELLPGTELYLESELAFRDRWKETGECREPSVIGRLELSDVALSVVQKQFGQDGYVDTDRVEMFSADDEIAETEAGLEEIDPIPKDSRAILKSLWESFSSLIEEDIERSSSSSGLTILDQKIYVGLEDGLDEPHIDVFENGTLRYIVTVVGPTTRFYNGNIPSTDFEDDGDFKQPNLPEGIVANTAPVGGVVRFLTEADPHCAPVDEPDQFRILLIATVGQAPINQAK